VTAGWVDLTGGDRPVAMLTEEGGQVMRGERPARLLLPQEADARGQRETDRGRAPSGPARERAPEAALELTVEQRALFDALRAQRLEWSKRDGVPPYVVASDRTLREIACARPRDAAALGQVHGIGESKLKRYGAGWLEVVARHPVEGSGA
jgi:ATP-dependent DNA helicase RecQ